MLNKLHVSKSDASQLSLCTHLTPHVWLLLLNFDEMSRSDGDHPNHKSMSVHAQVSSKEIDFLVGYSEPTPPNTNRNWPKFVTLVS